MKIETETLFKEMLKPPKKLPLWQEVKLFFSKTLVATDLAQDGTLTKVYYSVLNGKYFIRNIKTEKVCNFTRTLH